MWAPTAFALAGLLLSSSFQSPAAAASGCGTEVRGICGGTDGEDFEIIGQEGAGGASTGGPSSAMPAGGPSGPRVETVYAPTCTGNSPYGELGTLCNAALTCPDDREVKLWKWQSREVDGAWTAWEFVETVCVGADEPVIDPAVAVPAMVARDFQSVVVLKGGAEVTPRPDTLVNVATRFRTDAPASYDIPLSILGQSVVITARAESYTWHFGDGRSAVSYESGGQVEHAYREAVARQAYVVITWSGSFTVNGGARQAIVGTVSTTGDAVDVVVRQARSELVRD